MATYLYRLGAFVFERRRRVVALWLVVLAAVIASAMAFGGQTNDKFTVPGTESQQAQELLEEKFPAASGTYARIAFAAPSGERLTDPETAPPCRRRWPGPRRRPTSPRSQTRTRPGP
jgi:RND superfamily putative drug exporter